MRQGPQVSVFPVVLVSVMSLEDDDDDALRERISPLERR
jgi:hypothetical protein